MPQGKKPSFFVLQTKQSMKFMPWQISQPLLVWLKLKLVCDGITYSEFRFVVANSP